MKTLIGNVAKGWKGLLMMLAAPVAPILLCELVLSPGSEDGIVLLLCALLFFVVTSLLFYGAGALLNWNSNVILTTLALAMLLWAMAGGIESLFQPIRGVLEAMVSTLAVLTPAAATVLAALYRRRGRI